MLERFTKNPVVWPKVLLQAFSSSTRDFGVGFKGAVTWNDHMKYGKSRLGLCSEAQPASPSSLLGEGLCRFYFLRQKCLMASASFQQQSLEALKVSSHPRVLFPSRFNVGLRNTGPLSWGDELQPIISAGGAVGKKPLGDIKALMGTIFGRFDCLV